jgi:hypothetical protein
MIPTATVMSQELVAMPTAIWWRKFSLVRHFCLSVCLVLTVVLLNLLCSYFRKVPLLIFRVYNDSDYWILIATAECVMHNFLQLFLLFSDKLGPE